MKIESASIGMESARSYQASSYAVRRFEVKELTGAFSMEQFAPKGQNQESENSGENGNAGSLESLQQRFMVNRSNYKLRSSEEISARTIRDLTIEYIFQLLFDDWKEKWKNYLERNGISVGDSSGGTQMSMDNFSGGQLREYTYVEASYREEYENTAFDSQGIVKTADGRELSFDIHVGMSRAFSECYLEERGASFLQVCDPLVINLDGNVAEVTDQAFYFDIDADGEIDVVKQLGPGSAYLALDKNGDGKIGDGSELFGTSSGDGFADLSAYDEDGNGWIDENDSVWEKLTLWSHDGAGYEKIQSLSEAGVGALYLGNVETEFTQTDSDNQAKAYVRNTGIFLYENGMAGTMQHLDLVKYRQQA